jgi:hypothetical protein
MSRIYNHLFTLIKCEVDDRDTTISHKKALAVITRVTAVIHREHRYIKLVRVSVQSTFHNSFY